MATTYAKLKALETLQAARAILARPKGWTRGEYARNAKGEYRHVIADDATRFCSLGAICRATFEKTGGMFHDEYEVDNTITTALGEAIVKQSKGLFDRSTISSFNDHYGKKRDKRYVLRAFDRAIKSLKGAL